MPVFLVCAQSTAGLAAGELMIPSIYVYKDIETANQAHLALRLPPHSLV